MKVKDLISDLSEYDEDQEVRIVWQPEFDSIGAEKLTSLKKKPVTTEKLKVLDNLDQKIEQRLDALTLPTMIDKSPLFAAREELNRVRDWIQKERNN